MRFSDHFQLGKSQAELDFVDIPLTTDLPLFVDPYGISIQEGAWYESCNDLIVGFFDLVVKEIATGNRNSARQLLSNLREPNDTHLGWSSGKPRGSGIGSGQANDLYERLAASEAVRSGQISDLADAELIIPGIGRDKISDMTTNIIRGPLIAYTESQCELFNIPTRAVAAGMVWDPDRPGWRSKYARLPFFSGRILLVPKTAVRYDLSVDHRKYYRDFVLEFLQAEHLHAGSSLVSTLQNGSKKVYKKDLEARYPLSKDFLYEFSMEHPEVFEQYKDSLLATADALDDESIEARQPEPRDIDFDALVGELESLKPGRDDAGKYHNWVLGALTAIFHRSLMNPVKEREIQEGRKRIDILFTNRDKDGFFFNATVIHGIRCPYVPFECKNYSVDVSNPEFDQIAGRFSEYRGKLGFIVCRTRDDPPMLIARARDFRTEKGEFIIVLDDDDLKRLLACRAARDYAAIDAFLDQRLGELVL